MSQTSHSKRLDRFEEQKLNEVEKELARKWKKVFKMVRGRK